MIRLAFANLLHRKTRTAISIVAVAVEVALVLLLVGLTTGTLQEVGERIENIHSDMILLPPGARVRAVRQAVRRTRGPAATTRRAKAPRRAPPTE